MSLNWASRGREQLTHLFTYLQTCKYYCSCMNTSQHLQRKERDFSLVVWFVCFESLTSSFIAHCNTTGGPTMRLSRLYRYWYWGQSNSARTNTVSKSVFSASPNSSTLSVAMHGVLMSYRGCTVKEGGGGMQRSLSYRTSPFMTPQISNMLVKMEEYFNHFCGFSIKISTKQNRQQFVVEAPHQNSTFYTLRLDIICCSWYYIHSTFPSNSNPPKKVELGHF